MNDTETKVRELREEVKDFAGGLTPFFAGGRELIEDSLESKRAAEEAQAQDKSQKKMGLSADQNPASKSRPDRPTTNDIDERESPHQNPHIASSVGTICHSFC